MKENDFILESPTHLAFLLLYRLEAMTQFRKKKTQMCLILASGSVSIKLFESTSIVFSPQDIAVIKIVSDDGKSFGCFASPLNDKDAANPSAVRKSFDEGDEQVRAIDT